MHRTGVVGAPAATTTHDGNEADEIQVPCELLEAVESRTENSGYPDGGREAWMVVIGAWCAMTPSMGLLNTLAVLEAWMTEHDLHDVPKTTAAWIFSSYTFFLYFCGAQVGPVFDGHDIRYLIVPGSMGIVASLLLLSFSRGMSRLNTLQHNRR